MKYICRFILRLRGWHLSTKPLPVVDKAILIFAHHTSNWDFVTMVAAKFAWDINVKYLGKHSLFRWPYGWFFKALGGMPVIRHENNKVVDTVVDLIEANETIWLALSPEGTRSFTPYWKTGFYHIAKRANLPIIMFYLDNKTRTIGFSDIFEISGDIDKDMKVFDEYYASKQGYIPEKASIIQTKRQYKLSQKAKNGT